MDDSEWNEGRNLLAHGEAADSMLGDGFGAEGYPLPEYSTLEDVYHSEYPRDEPPAALYAEPVAAKGEETTVQRGPTDTAATDASFRDSSYVSDVHDEMFEEQRSDLLPSQVRCRNERRL